MDRFGVQLLPEYKSNLKAPLIIKEAEGTTMCVNASFEKRSSKQTSLHPSPALLRSWFRLALFTFPFQATDKRTTLSKDRLTFQGTLNMPQQGGSLKEQLPRPHQRHKAKECKVRFTQHLQAPCKAVWGDVMASRPLLPRQLPAPC